MNLKEAKMITGHKSGLGKPSKMPGYSTSISAADCVTGAKLAKIEGSVCSKCYAFRGNYLYPGVKAAHEARKKALSDSRWVDAMTLLIGHYTDKNDAYFRIHDAGDIQSPEHLQLWVSVARNLPWVNFWMPSKEVKWVKAGYKTTENWPTNLVVRLSAPMIGQAPPASIRGFPTSTVSANTGEECRAYTRDNKCGPCRACWNPEVDNIDYHRQ